VNYAAERENI
jgi:hypothetical protein